jgi:hypothetical protein
MNRAIFHVHFLTAELLAGPLGDNSAMSAVAPDEEPAVSPLEGAVAGMRAAGERITARDTGAETRTIQRKVVDDLKALIEMARQQQGQPAQASSQPESPNAQSQPEEDAGQQTDQEPQESRQNGPASDGKNRENAADSEVRAANADVEEAQTILQRRLVDEVWGHLPARLRQKVQNVSSEKTLPRYEDLVRRYFEALAEDQPAGNGR